MWMENYCKVESEWGSWSWKNQLQCRFQDVIYVWEINQLVIMNVAMITLHISRWGQCFWINVSLIILAVLSLFDIHMRCATTQLQNKHAWKQRFPNFPSRCHPFTSPDFTWQPSSNINYCMGKMKITIGIINWGSIIYYNKTTNVKGIYNIFTANFTFTLCF